MKDMSEYNIYKKRKKKSVKTLSQSVYRTLSILGLMYIITLFLVGGVSAGWTDSAKYSANDKGVEDMKVTMKSYWGFFEWLGIDQTVGTFELKSHTNPDEIIKVGLGEQVVMYYDFDFKELYSNGLGEVKFTNMKTGKVIEKDYKYVYWKTEEKEREVCNEWNLEIDLKGNQSLEGLMTDENCVNFVKEKYNNSYWADYNVKNIPQGKIRIGIMVDSKEGDYIDGVWIVGGKEISRHAGWEASLNTDLAYYYSFEESSGNFVDNKSGNTLIVTGTIGRVAGKVGNGAGFVGSASNYLTSTSNVGIYGGQQRTVCFWMNSSNYSSLYTFDFVGWGTGFDNKRWSIQHTGGAGGFQVASYGTDYTTNVVGTTGIYQFHCVTYTGAKIEWYINGVSRANMTTSALDTGVSAFRVGYDDQYKKPLYGTIDELGIWNRTLTGAEVSLLYNSGYGCAYGECVAGLEISLLSPADDYTTTNSEISFMSNVNGIGATVENVSLVIDDVIVLTNTSGVSGNYTFTYDLGSDGSYDWRVIAYDTDDNIYFSDENRTVTIDGTDPVISAGLNQTILYREGEIILLNTTITDTNLDTVWYEYDGSNTTIVGAETGVLNQTAITTTLDALTIIIHANDTAGNTANTYQLNLTVDTGNPTIEIIYGNGTLNYGNLNVNHTINFTATDDNLDSCWYYYSASETDSFETDFEDWEIYVDAGGDVSRSSAWSSLGDWSVHVKGNGGMIGGSERIYQSINLTDVDLILFDIKIVSGGVSFSHGSLPAFWTNNTIGEFDNVKLDLSGVTGLKIISFLAIDTGEFYIDNIRIYNKTDSHNVECTSGVETTFNFELTEGIYQATVYANDTAGNINSEDVEWEYRIFETGREYSETSTTTTLESFYLNFTTRDAVIPVVYLVYDGVEYLSTRTGTSTEHQISNSIGIISDGEKQFRWKITWDGTTIYTLYSNQTVVTVSLLNFTSGSSCPAGLTKVMDFTFKDEGNQSSLDEMNVKYNFKYGISNSSGANSYGSLNNISQFSVCINTTLSPTYYLDYGEIEYVKESYVSRRYYVFANTRVSNETINTTLHSLFTSDSTSFLIEVRSPELRPFTNQYISLLRWYPGEDEYKVVEMGKTDDKGQTIVKVKVEDVDYRIGIYNLNGTLVHLINPIRMVCLFSPCSYTITVTGTTTDILDELTNIQAEITWDGVDTFTLIYNDPSQNTELMTLKVTQTGSVTERIICESNGTSFTGILTCNVSGYDGRLKAVAYRTASPARILAMLMIDTLTTVFQGTFGLFLQFLIIVTLAFAGIMSPIAAIIMGIVALMFGAFVIKTITYSILVSIAILGGIIIYFLRRQ